MWIFHASYSPFLCTSCYPCPLAKGGGKCGGTLGFVTEALAPAWGSCFFTFPTKPSLGFVSTAAATCSHPWPPQLSPLPQGHLACGSLCTFTEHRSCRRQQRPAAPSPAAPKIGESQSRLLYRGGEGVGAYLPEETGKSHRDKVLECLQFPLGPYNNDRKWWDCKLGFISLFRCMESNQGRSNDLSSVLVPRLRCRVEKRNPLRRMFGELRIWFLKTHLWQQQNKLAGWEAPVVAVIQRLEWFP